MKSNNKDFDQLQFFIRLREIDLKQLEEIIYNADNNKEFLLTFMKD